ncbi:MAG: hypothetical protein PHP53_10500 [Prolixibacteraceae bacterium]|nr:hypothetical protein [Prolixibacteraceae bacterium]
MKTMLKVTFLFALVAFANILFAAGNLKVNILPVNSEKAVVAVSTLSDSNFNLTITDDMDNIIYYQENLSTEGNYRKVYNLADLEDGAYKLTVVSDDLTAERQFNKSHGKIVVGEEKTTIEPFFGYEAGILRCSYLNFNKEDMALHFFKNNELIYSKSVGKGFNLQEALNLSKLDKGKYEAVLYAGEKRFSYPVQIQ